MISARIIPVLLLKDGGLVKTIQFKNPTYVGDPINAVKIFNDKEVDELIFLDITASQNKRKPNTDFIKHIAEECFMPLCYGGGIHSLQDIENVLKVGVEKIAINTACLENSSFIKEAVIKFGGSTIVGVIDFKKNIFGKYVVYEHTQKKSTKIHPLDLALKLESSGVGEILLNSVDKDGTMEGYDIMLIKSIAEKINVPIIGCGGAGNIDHIVDLIKETQISAAAAGSMFVFRGKHRAVLINYPNLIDIQNRLSQKN